MMTQTPSGSKCPMITFTPDGNGWSYLITWNGIPIRGAWIRGTKRDAQRDAAYRLSVWQDAQQQQRREAAA